jgi:hypothetical protein
VIGDRVIGDRRIGDRGIGDRRIGDRGIGDRRIGDRGIGDRAKLRPGWQRFCARGLPPDGECGSIPRGEDSQCNEHS